MTTSIEELRTLVAQSILSTEAFKEQLAASQEEADRRAAEAAKTTEELKRQIKELGKQLGGIGNKFGSFTEGLLLPSVETMLHKKFGVTDFYMRLKTKRGAELQELDGFGFVNGKKISALSLRLKAIWTDGA